MNNEEAGSTSLNKTQPFFYGWELIFWLFETFDSGSVYDGFGRADNCS